MTGIAEFYLYLKRPTEDRRKLLFGKRESHQRFVVLSWKRTGSNLLCGILYHHPEIVMHNELFNPIDIFTYYPRAFKEDPYRWTVLTRDLAPDDFLAWAWSGKFANDEPIRRDFKAVGFKSFPDHWFETRNEDIWERAVVEDSCVKKIILHRRDELATYVSMLRAEETGHYMTLQYPKGLKVHVDPARFQTFLYNYRDTFRRKYKSPTARRDTFRIDYEQLVDRETFESDIAPKLYDFLGVNTSAPVKALRETIKQAEPDEDLTDVIENYDELEFCFRHSDVIHFEERRKEGKTGPFVQSSPETNQIDRHLSQSTWSLLLPICSKTKATVTAQCPPPENIESFNKNRLSEVTIASQYNLTEQIDQQACWALLEAFCESLRKTVSEDQLARTECVIGIDQDDAVYNDDNAKKRMRAMLVPCKVIFVDIEPTSYGKICKIWNHLARRSTNDYIVLLGDDIRLFDNGWQERIAQRFHQIADKTELPLGAACVALKDKAFPGFPTFPVVHRWHVDFFGSLLPKQFVNQGGDPYLFELYSRFNAASFEVSCSLENTIGGDGDARYKKHDINWRGQILELNLKKLSREFGEGKGVTLDVVVPSFRTNNNKILQRIARLRATTDVYVKFWFVVDNPLQPHVEEVRELAAQLNQKQLQKDGNYFVNVIHYGENKGASYARNVGYNYSTADWVLFLDDDVEPEAHLLDAYIGAIRRNPQAKVFVGLAQLPDTCNMWTTMLKTCNVGYFYGISNKMTHPSWGVTANLMVRGSRHNPTIQFKHLYPKTGGGEDIDFVFQYKEWYRTHGINLTVGVPEAKVRHPWWNNGGTCYRQITGWAWGDSLCITQWPRKTFLTFPNWIEHLVFIVMPLSAYSKMPFAGLACGLSITLVEHALRGVRYLPSASWVCGPGSSVWRKLLVAVGAGTVMSAQEVTRVVACIRRVSLFSVCRRVDWFDGQQPRIQLDTQLGSALRFGMNAGLTWLAFHWFRK